MNKLRKIIRSIIKEANDEFDYRGEHSASHRSDNYSSPIYDMTNSFGEDIYGPNAVRYFGTGDPNDSTAISIIKSLRNRPNATLTIYRAIPDFNYDIKSQTKKIYDITGFFNKFGFFPMNHKNSNQIQLMNDLYNKYSSIENYDEKQKKIYDDLISQAQELNMNNKEVPKINDGDWVTTVKEYATEHGKAHLKNRYKILTKKVKAKNVYGNGDSVFEFGYSA